jgi:hypothetical protein
MTAGLTELQFSAELNITLNFLWRMHSPTGVASRSMIRLNAFLR